MIKPNAHIQWNFFNLTQTKKKWILRNILFITVENSFENIISHNCVRVFFFFRESSILFQNRFVT